MYLSIPGLLRNKAGICRNGKEHLKKTGPQSLCHDWPDLHCGAAVDGDFADKLTTHNPELADITNKFLPASREYPLGTDQMGRCMLCRLIYGIRVSMFSAIKVTFIIVLIGVFWVLWPGIAAE